MRNIIYHGNLLSTEFKSEEFLKKCKILEKRKSNRDNWIHYLTEIPIEKPEDAISDIQSNLLPELYYAHLYNGDGSDVIVIFPSRTFRLSAANKTEWEKVKSYMTEYGIKIKRWQDVKPRTFLEEKEYYLHKPLVQS